MRYCSIFSGLIATIHVCLGFSLQNLLGNSVAQSLLTNSIESDFSSDLSLLSLHKNLVELPSISDNEEAVALFLQNYLTSKGLTVELDKVSDSPKRYNVYAYVGSTRRTKVLLTSHIDTVPPYLPYYVEDSRIYGRGSCDAKASVATQIIAFLELLNSNDIKEGDVSLLFVVGEEKDGSGMMHASKHLQTTWDSAIFGEPTELKLGVGHKGVYGFSIRVRGKASHSGYPELGISANEILIPTLNKLLQLELPSSELLGPSTMNIGRMEGGVAANVIPAFAEASVFIRVASGLDEIDELVHNTLVGIDHLQFEVIQRSKPQSLAFDVPGFETIVLAYATDVPHLKGDFKKYLYGPGSILVAHGDDEYVEVDDLNKAVDGYKKLVAFALADD